jgi:hypothetical protein
MCIINNEVNSVSKTKIYASLNNDRSRQITVYSNKVDTSYDNNAMILPLVYPETVEFHDLSGYANFFDECSKCFEVKDPTFGIYSSTNSLSLNKCLKIHNVGSYLASIANNIDDIKRINPKYFVISDGAYDVLKKNYKNKNYGFIICKLKPGNHEYHPFAYSHKAIADKLFIPTRHYHDGESKNDFLDQYFTIRGNQGNQNDYLDSDEYADDWDHDIYVLNYDTNNNNNSYIKQLNTAKYRWKNKCDINLSKYNFSLPSAKNFERITINGRHRNRDLIVSVC